MRKLVTVTTVGAVSLVALFVVAGRNIGELGGYFRASADQTIDQVVHSLPEEVHDRKVDHEIKHVRQELVERQVQLNLSRNQLDQLRDDVAKLKGNVARRKRLLAEAYPILKKAVEQGKQTVRFANVDFTLTDFHREIDDLIAEQEQGSRKLEIKRQGLVRLEKSVAEGEHALAEMCRALETTEQEIAVLKSRREQAEIEAQTLDMISSVSAEHQLATASVNASLNRLRKGVERLEAQNQARRSLAPVSDRPLSNQVDRHWTRLESLKAIYEEVEEQPGQAEKRRASAAQESLPKRTHHTGATEPCGSGGRTKG